MPAEQRTMFRDRRANDPKYEAKAHWPESAVGNFHHFIAPSAILFNCQIELQHYLLFIFWDIIYIIVSSARGANWAGFEYGLWQFVTDLGPGWNDKNNIRGKRSCDCSSIRFDKGLSLFLSSESRGLVDGRAYGGYGLSEGFGCIGKWKAVGI